MQSLLAPAALHQEHAGLKLVTVVNPVSPPNLLLTVARLQFITLQPADIAASLHILVEPLQAMENLVLAAAQVPVATEAQ
jgi:hypothetical protein